MPVLVASTRSQHVLVWVGTTFVLLALGAVSPKNLDAQVVVQKSGGGAVGGAGGSDWASQSFYNLPGFYVLSQEPVRREIQLLPHQEEELQQIAKGIQKRWQELWSAPAARDLSTEERTKQYQQAQEKMRGLQEEATQAVKKVLLPHQLKVLEQVELRMRLAPMLQYGWSLDRVGLSESQREQLRKNRSELAEKIYELQKQSFDEMMKVLTPEQIEKLKQPIQAAPGQSAGTRPN